MAEFISITLQGEVRGRQICSIPLNINTQARVSQLRELITEGLHIKGTLYHQDKNINLKMCTLAELQIGNGALLKIKSYQKMKDTPMQEIPLCILPHREWCTVQVPARVTVRLLKFIIECEQRIPISDQALTRDNQRWVQDTNSLHQCTEEELQRLQVEDTSKSIKTPQNDMPTITINADCDFQNGSPKIESDYKTFPSAERDFSSGTESGDSDPNLIAAESGGQPQDNHEAVTKSTSGAAKQRTSVEESRQQTSAQYQYLRKSAPLGMKNTVFPSTKRSQLVLPSGAEIPGQQYLLANAPAQDPQGIG